MLDDEPFHFIWLTASGLQLTAGKFLTIFPVFSSITFTEAVSCELLAVSLFDIASLLSDTLNDKVVVYGLLPVFD